MANSFLRTHARISVAPLANAPDTQQALGARQRRSRPKANLIGNDSQCVEKLRDLFSVVQEITASRTDTPEQSSRPVTRQRNPPLKPVFVKAPHAVAISPKRARHALCIGWFLADSAGKYMRLSRALQRKTSTRRERSHGSGQEKFQRKKRAPPSPFGSSRRPTSRRPCSPWWWPLPKALK